MTNEANAVLRMEAAALKLHGNDLVNHGLIEMTGSYARIYRWNSSSGAWLVNESTGTVDGA
jgi:hypothetical protein